jgi:prolyl oligopeptidase
MFIVRKKSVLPTLYAKIEEPLPTMLYAYGGFGVSRTPFFSVSNLLFMDKMNGIYALASIRGGGEFGEEWHKASVKEKK